MVGGAALGALSRFEEATPGFYAGISSSTAWLAAAFAAGAGARRAEDATAHGALTLTIANGAYYLRGTYDPVEKWLVLGVAGGVVFGWLGSTCRHAGAPWRQLAATVMLGVAAFELAGIQTRAFGPALP